MDQTTIYVEEIDNERIDVAKSDQRIIERLISEMEKDGFTEAEMTGLFLDTVKKSVGNPDFLTERDMGRILARNLPVEVFKIARTPQLARTALNMCSDDMQIALLQQSTVNKNSADYAKLNLMKAGIAGDRRAGIYAALLDDSQSLTSESGRMLQEIELLKAQNPDLSHLSDRQILEKYFDRQ